MFLEAKVKGTTETLDPDRTHEVLEQLGTSSSDGTLRFTICNGEKERIGWENADITQARARHLYDQWAGKNADTVRVEATHTRYHNSWGETDFVDIELYSRADGRAIATIEAEFISGEPMPALTPMGGFHP